MIKYHPSRREALLYAVAVLGGVLISPGLAAAVESGVSRSGSSLKFLSIAQNALVGGLAETILPETDTPGATAAGVDRFIDMMLADWYPKKESDRFIAGLVDIEKRCLVDEGEHFLTLPAARRLAFLERLDAETAAMQVIAGRPAPFFAMLKELVLVGYYTSEVGEASIGYIGPIGDDYPEDEPVRPVAGLLGAKHG